MRSIFLLLLLFVISPHLLEAQTDAVKFNDHHSILSFESTNKGILVPRMTEAQKTGISNKVAGLIIYQTDGEKGIYQYNGSEWIHTGNNPVPYQVGDGIGMTSDTLKIAIPGQQAGDMFYYNGTNWVKIPKGLEGQKLSLINGIPTWVN